MGIGTNLKGLILGNDPVTSGPLPDLIPLDDPKIKKINSDAFLKNKLKDSSEVKLAEGWINCDFLPQSRPVRQCLFQIQTARLSLS